MFNKYFGNFLLKNSKTNGYSIDKYVFYSTKPMHSVASSNVSDKSINLIDMKKYKNLEHPKLDFKFAKKIETVTAIDVSNDLITWIKVNRDGLVLDWNYHKYTESLKDDDFETSFDYLQSIFDTKLPKESSVFLFETRVYKSKQSKFVTFLIRIQQRELILKSIIKSFINHQKSLSNNQIDSIPRQKIFSINSTKEAKQFRLLIGGERINSTELVEKILKYDELNSNDPRLNDTKEKMFIINTPQKFKDFFFNPTHDQSIINVETKNSIREPLSKNYLQASSFIKIIKKILPYF